VERISIACSALTWFSRSLCAFEQQREHAQGHVCADLDACVVPDRTDPDQALDDLEILLDGVLGTVELAQRTRRAHHGWVRDDHAEAIVPATTFPRYEIELLPTLDNVTPSASSALRCGS